MTYGGRFNQPWGHFAVIDYCYVYINKTLAWPYIKGNKMKTRTRALKTRCRAEIFVKQCWWLQLFKCGKATFLFSNYSNLEFRAVGSDIHFDKASTMISSLSEIVKLFFSSPSAESDFEKNIKHAI